MNKISPIEFIKKTPKAELHLHIEGTLEPELLFKLAKRNNIQIPFTNINEIKSAYNFSNTDLKDLEKLLFIDDEIIYKWYFEKYPNIAIPNTKVSAMLKNFKL